jgi:hypothetical protein
MPGQMGICLSKMVVVKDPGGLLGAQGCEDGCWRGRSSRSSHGPELAPTLAFRLGTALSRPGRHPAAP